MARTKPLEQSIKELEHTLAKYNAVLKVFPDAKIHETYWPARFSSKAVNLIYTKLEFKRHYNTLRVMPYCEVEFEHNGTSELIVVNTSPKYSRLAYIPWSRKGENKVIKFSRVAVNLKNNNFKEDMMNECRVHIMNFIKDNPGYKLDDKHLEPRLKKLLLFT
jgi:hypothetical protein